jgi:transposase-like protein
LRSAAWLVASKQYQQAQGVLERARSRTANAWGLLVQRAQSHYWFSQALAGAGDAGSARQQLQGAQRVLDEIKREATSDKSGAILKRAHLAPIAAAK